MKYLMAEFFITIPAFIAFSLLYFLIGFDLAFIFGLGVIYLGYSVLFNSAENRENK